MWRNNIEPVIIEDTQSGYRSRTVKNAEWSDITLALAIDAGSPGELETKEAAADKLLPYRLLDGDIAITEPSFVERLLSEVTTDIRNHPRYKSFSKEGLKLNIAGNRLAILFRHGISQQEIDDLLHAVIEGLLENGIAIAEVRSGGQSGVDEAGIHAAQDCSLPCSILCPKGFRFSTAEGHELSGAEKFTVRFKSLP